MVVSVLIPEDGEVHDMELLPHGIDPMELLQGPIHQVDTRCGNYQMFWSSSSYLHSKVNEMASSIARQQVKGDAVIHLSKKPLLECEQALPLGLEGQLAIVTHLRGAYHLQHVCQKARSRIHVSPPQAQPELTGSKGRDVVYVSPTGGSMADSWGIELMQADALIGDASLAGEGWVGGQSSNAATTTKPPAPGGDVVYVSPKGGTMAASWGVEVMQADALIGDASLTGAGWVGGGGAFPTAATTTQPPAPVSEGGLQMKLSAACLTHHSIVSPLAKTRSSDIGATQVVWEANVSKISTSGDIISFAQGSNTGLGLSPHQSSLTLPSAKQGSSTGHSLHPLESACTLPSAMQGSSTGLGLSHLQSSSPVLSVFHDSNTGHVPFPNESATPLLTGRPSHVDILAAPSSSPAPALDAHGTSLSPVLAIPSFASPKSALDAHGTFLSPVLPDPALALDAHSTFLSPVLPDPALALDAHSTFLSPVLPDPALALDAHSTFLSPVLPDPALALDAHSTFLSPVLPAPALALDALGTFLIPALPGPASALLDQAPVAASADGLETSRSARLSSIADLPTAPSTTADLPIAPSSTTDLPTVLWSTTDLPTAHPTTRSEVEAHAHPAPWTDLPTAHQPTRSEVEAHPHPAPWTDLPSGLVSLICLQLPHTAASVILLSHICKSWRQELLDDPHLLSQLWFGMADVRHPLKAHQPAPVVVPNGAQGPPTAQQEASTREAPATVVPSKHDVLGLVYWGTGEPSAPAHGIGPLGMAGVANMSMLAIAQQQHQHQQHQQGLVTCSPIAAQLKVALKKPPKMLLNAAAKHNLSALITLAQLQEMAGLHEDAMRHWKRCAKHGSLEGQFKFGLALYEGVKGVGQDSETAYFWLNKAVRQTSLLVTPVAPPAAAAQVQSATSSTAVQLPSPEDSGIGYTPRIMGYMHYDGETVEALAWNGENREGAVRMFKVAAAYGCIEGQRALGWMFNTGVAGRRALVAPMPARSPAASLDRDRSSSLGLSLFTGRRF
eukprot:gene18747-25275_t